MSVKRKRTITCKNCGFKLVVTGPSRQKTRRRRVGPPAIGNVERGRLLAKFSAENLARTGSRGPFTQAQKDELGAVIRGERQPRRKRVKAKRRKGKERVFFEDIPLPSEGPAPPGRISREAFGRGAR